MKLRMITMASHKLVSYWFRLRETYETDESDYWNLNELTSHRDEFNHDSLIQVLNEFFDQFHGNIDEVDDRQRTFEVDRYETGDNLIEGEIKLGEYGIEADVYDTQQQQRMPRHRKSHHSEETPFYFLFYKPPNNDTRVVAVLKQYRARGVKGELYGRLDEYITDHDTDDEEKDIVCELKPVYTQDAEERITNADDFKRLKFEGIQELTPMEEHADNEGATGADRRTVSRTYEIKPTSESRWTPDFVRSFFPDGNWKYGQLERDEFDDVKLTVEEDGSRITFSLWDADIRMRRELDPMEDNLDMDGGHPTAASLSPRAREVVNIVLPPEDNGPDDGTLF